MLFVSINFSLEKDSVGSVLEFQQNEPQNQ